MSPLSGVIGESWQLYKTHARHLISVAFVVFLPIAVISLIVTLAGGWFGRLLVDLVFFIGLYLLEAALVKAVQDVRDGTADLSIGQTFAAAMPSLGSVLGASVLAGILIWIGFFLIIIPGIILATIWSLIVPVIVLENVGALVSFGRSQQLVRGRFWNVLGTLVLVILILLAVEILLALIFGSFPAVLTAFFAVLIAGSVVSPFGATVVTLMYFRLVAAPVGGPVGAGSPYGNQNPYGSAAPGTYGGPPPGGQYEGGGFAPPGQQGAGFQPSGPPDSGFAPPSGPQDGGSAPTP